jgi:8-oxo-dGTP pyrophosphatase MutT (NUDIX family)
MLTVRRAIRAHGATAPRIAAMREWSVVLSRIFRRATRQEATDADASRQSGAIPYKIVGDQIAFLLVTSRRTGRWIFPKGAPIEGMTPREVAVREAMEEAGVEGVCDAEPIGSYRTVKVRGVLRTVFEVDMYPLEVETQHEEWTEKGQRHRHWVLLPEAKRLLSDPVLVELTVKLQARLKRRARPVPQPAKAFINR